MWLNESFATQMASLALSATTEFTDMWHGYFTNNKKGAYLRDSRVTTHPIDMPVDSTDMFTSLFDAITYDKGGSVLKQLQFRVGAENYRRGVSAYLKEYSYGTTELADFIRHQGEASGIDLRGWSGEWLLTPGFNTLAAEPVCDDGTLRSLTVTQSAPAELPLLRTHKTVLALYSLDAANDIVVTDSLPITIRGARTDIPVPGTPPCPVLVNPNFDDFGYARISISDTDAVVLREYLGKVRDPLSRSMFLAALFDKALAGDMPLADFAQLALDLADTEQNFRVLEQLSAALSGTVHLLQRLGPDADEALARVLGPVESLALRRAHFAPTQDLKQLWFGLFLEVAASDTARQSIPARS
jgi:aminopeptidase N